MTERSPEPTSDEQILLRCEDEVRQRGPQVCDEYALQYPHLAREIRDLQAMNDRIAASRPEPPMPEQLGEFRIVREIARGGMGVIYEAVQERLNRRVALKTIRAGRISDELRERFAREQEILARLHQTHVVPIHTAGEAEGLHYFVMPYITGVSLNRVVEALVRGKVADAGSRTPGLGKLVELASGEDARPPLAPVPRGEGLLLLPPLAPVLRGEGSGVRGSSPATEAPLTPNPSPPKGGRGEPDWRPTKLSRAYFRSIAAVMADVADAVQHAHDAGVLHRDLKPSNVMVDTAEQCWIIDFGLGGYAMNHAPSAPRTSRKQQVGWAESSRPTGQDASRDRHPRARGRPRGGPRRLGPPYDYDSGPPPATASDVMGTPQYMAPEQVAGKLDARSDVWGVGVTLYELLALRRAFDGATPAEVFEQVLTREPAPPGKWVRNVPEDLAAICRKAMKKEPAARYATAGAFAEDVRRWLNGEVVEARGWQPLRRAARWAGRKPGWAATLVVGVLTLFACGVGAFFYLDARRWEGLREHARLLNLMHFIRVSQRSDGWAKRAWELAEQAAAIRKDENVRDQAAATLIGLDGERVKWWDKLSSSSVAIDAKGRVLIGGADPDVRWGLGVSPARLWDGKHDDLHLSRQTGDGPVAFRPDGTPLQLVLDHKDRRSLLLWDVSRQRLVRSFHSPVGETEKVSPLLFMTTNGAYVARAEAGRLSIWSAETGQLISDLAGNASAVAVSPDGTLAAMGDEAGTITVWHLPKGEKVATLQSGEVKVLCLAFHPDVRRPGADKRRVGWILASGDQGGNVFVWDLDRKSMHARCTGSYFEVHALAFSPDNMTLASGGRNAVRLWDISTGRPLWSAKAGDKIVGVAYSPDGEWLACAGSPFFFDSHVNVWRLEAGRGLRSLRGLVTPVVKTAFCPTRKLVASLSQDGQVGLWNVSTGHLKHVLAVDPGGFTADNVGLAFSRDGLRLAVAAGRHAALWNLGTGRIEDSWKLDLGLANALAFAPDGNLLLIRGESTTGRWEDRRSDPRSARLWRLVPGGHKQLVVGNTTDFQWRVLSTVAAPDGSWFAVDGQADRLGHERKLVVLDGTTGKMLWAVDRSKTDGEALTTDSTGKLLFYLSGARVRGVEMASRNPVELPDTNSNEIGPGARYWTSSKDSLSGVLVGKTVFRRESKRRPLVWLGIDTPISGVGISFDATGGWLAWGNADGTVTLCEIEEVRRRLATIGLGWPPD